MSNDLRAELGTEEDSPKGASLGEPGRTWRREGEAVPLSWRRSLARLRLRLEGHRARVGGVWETAGLSLGILLLKACGGAVEAIVEEIEDLVEDPGNDADTGTPHSMAVGQSFTGSVTSVADEDWVRVQLSAGDVVAATLQPRSAASDLDPVLELRDAQGRLLRSNDDADSHPQDDDLIPLASVLSSRIIFEVQTTGTYYLSVEGLGVSTGDYRLTLEEVPDATDPNGGIWTSESITVGGSFTGAVDSATDEDWVRVQLNQGDLVAATLQAEGSSSLDPVLVLRDDQGNLLLRNDDAESHPQDDGLIPLTSTRSSRLVFEVDTTGTYYLAVEGLSGTGDYRLTLEEVSGASGTNDEERSDAEAGTGTTYSLDVGSSFIGTVGSSTDADWVRIELNRGDLVAATLQAEGSSRLDPVLELRDAQGNLLLRDDDADPYTRDDNLIPLTSTLSSRIIFDVQTTGTYYLSVEGVQPRTGDYRLTLEDFDPTDINGGVWTPDSVAVGGNFTGTVSSATDEDWARVQLTQGDVVAATLQADGASNLDPMLELRGALGGWLRSNNDASSHPQDDDLIPLTNTRSSRIVFEVDETGTYYFAVGGYQTSTGDYRLTLEEVPDIATDEGREDAPEDVGTTHSLAVGDSFTGTVAIGTDDDWVRIELNRGDLVAVTLQPEGSSNLDPYLEVLSAQGVVLFVNDNARPHLHDDDLIVLTDSNSSRLVFNAEETGTYYLNVRSFGTSTGEYRLTLEQIPDAGEGTGTTYSMAVGESLTGTVTTDRDQDWVRVQLDQGDVLAATVQRDGSSSLDPILELRDAQGALLLSNNNAASHPQDGDLIPLTDTLSSRIVFEVVTTGTYYLNVKGPDDAGSALMSRGDYRLTLEEVPDASGLNEQSDAPAGTGTTYSMAVGESFTGTVASSTDEDWVRVQLTQGDFLAATLQAEGSSNLDSLLGLVDDQGNYLRVNADALSHPQDDNLIPLTSTLSSRIIFDVQTTGIYYLTMAGYQMSTGDYRLTLEEVPDAAPDDAPADTTTPHSLDVGSSFTGTVSSATDVDWVRVSLTRDDLVAATLQAEGSSSLNPVLELRDAQGAQIQRNDDAVSHPQDDDLVTLTSTNSSRIVFDVQTTGTYYLAVDGSGSTTGDYRLTLEEVPDAPRDNEQSDAPAGTGTTYSLAVGNSFTGTVASSTDEDWVQVSLTQGDLVAATAQAEGSSSLNPVLELHDAQGNLLFSNDDANSYTQDDNLISLTSARSSRLIFDVQTTGTYYLSVEGVRSSTGDYRLTLEDFDPTDPDGGTWTPDSMAVGDVLTGTVASRTDVDWVRVSLTQGDSVVATLQAEGSSNLDSYLELRDDQGDLLLSNDDAESHPQAGDLVALTSARSSRIVFEADTTGTYYLAVAAWASRTMGDYRLTLEEAPDPSNANEQSDAEASTGTTYSLSVGSSFTGTVASSTDEDWVRVSLTQGDLVAATAQAEGSSSLDPVLELRDDQGNLLFRNDDANIYTWDDNLILLTSTDSSRIVFDVQTTGTYYLSVEGVQPRTGDYRLTLEDFDPTDPNEGTWTPNSMVVGESFTSTVSDMGENWVRVSLTQGDILAATLQARGSSILDPVLALLNYQGDEITENDNAGSHSRDDDLIPLTSTESSRIVFEVATTGTYYLSVRGFGPIGGDFRLTLEEVPDVPDVPDTNGEGEDAPASTETPYSLAVGDSFTGSLADSFDRDWVRIVLDAGDHVVVTLQADGSSSLDPELTLRDDQGTYVDRNRDATDSTPYDDGLIPLTSSESSRIFIDRSDSAAQGTFYLAVESERGAGDYRLTLEEVPEPTSIHEGTGDAPDGSETAYFFGVGEFFLGTVASSTDQDWVRIELVEGDLVAATVQAEGSSNLNPYLQLRSELGAVIDNNNDAFSHPLVDGLIPLTNSNSSRIIFNADEIHHLEVRGYQGSTGEYRLTLEAVPDDVRGSIETTTSMAVGESLTGTVFIDYDEDWVRIELTQGDVLAATVQAESSRLDPSLRLRDDQGNLLRSNNDARSHPQDDALVTLTSSESSRLVFDADTMGTGTFYLAVDGGGVTTGDYRLTLERVPDAAPPASDTNEGGDFAEFYAVSGQDGEDAEYDDLVDDGGNVPELAGTQPDDLDGVSFGSEDLG